MTEQLRKRFLICFLMGLTLCETAHANPVTLKGGVERNAELKALQVGMPFTKELLPKTGTKDLWYPVPEWFAGTWWREQVHEITPKGEVTWESHAEGSRGRKRDGRGQIWDRVQLPMVQEVDEVQRKLYFIHHVVEILHSDAESVVIKLSGDVVTVDPFGIVTAITTNEERMTAQPVSPGKIKVFHEKHDVASHRAYNEEWRIRPFSPVADTQ